jgi:four helix bundle protein
MNIDNMNTEEQISKNNPIRTFKDLDAWKHGHEAVLLVYKITKNFPHDEQFGLTTQMRRAAVSVTSNIAEGFGRHTAKDKTQFYAIAKGSVLELQSQLQVAKDLSYITTETCKSIDEALERTARLIFGLIRSASSR